MDITAYKREFAKHIAEMARCPGFIDHARHTCMKFAKEYPQVFGDLPQLVRNELGESDETASRT